MGRGRYLIFYILSGRPRGGFIAGALMIQLFKDPALVARHRALARYV